MEVQQNQTSSNHPLDPEILGLRQIMKAAADQLVHEMLVFLNTQEMSDAMHSSSPQRAERSKAGIFRMTYDNRLHCRVIALINYFNKEKGFDPERVNRDVFQDLHDEMENSEPMRERMKRIIFWLSSNASSL